MYNLHKICIPNFNSLHQFGEEIWEKKFQKWEKLHKKLLFATVRVFKGFENLKAPKICTEHQRNLHIKFHLSISIWWGEMRRTNFKSNNYCSQNWDCERVRGGWKLKHLIKHIESSQNVHIKFQLSSSILRGDMGKAKSKNEKNSSKATIWSRESRHNRVENSAIPDLCKALVESTYQISTHWHSLEGRYGKGDFQKWEQLLRKLLFGAATVCNRVENSNPSRKSTY